MEKAPKTATRVRLWISYILQTVLAFFFLLGAVMNLMQTETAVAQAIEMGYPESSVRSLGVLLLLSTLIYIVPRTSVLGALLLTGWLGGAVASHIIHGDPLFNIMFPVIFGILIWFILWLRDPELSRLLPYRR